MSNYESNHRGGRRGRGRGRRGGNLGNECMHPEITANWEERINDFDLLDINLDILHIVYSYGFQYPTDIQSLTIKPILLGRNIIAQAQIKSGKTFTFIIGILQSINTYEETTQALVLVPTSQLSDQIYDIFKLIGMRLPRLQLSTFKEGESVQQQKEKAAKLPHIIITTPDCALSLIKEGYIRCENLKIVCLDEANELLNQRFNSQINETFSLLDPAVQKLIFSTQITPEILDLMNKFMNDPVITIAKPERLTLDGVRQYFLNVGNCINKLPVLIDILGKFSTQKVFIFVNKKSTVIYLQSELEKAHFEVSAIHREMEQNIKNNIIEQFLTGNSRALIATDYDATQINFDFQRIHLVINFELPASVENYIHNVGHFDRCGHQYVALNICDESEIGGIRFIERFYHTKIDEAPTNIHNILQNPNNS